MAYCFECGSEVAPDDVFCPYCGISLTPVNAGVLVIDEPFTSPTEQAKEIDASETTDGVAGRADDYSLSDTEENWNLPSESADFPANDSAGINSPKLIPVVEANNEIAVQPPSSSSEENQMQNSSLQADSSDSRENEFGIAEQNSVIENISENPLEVVRRVCRHDALRAVRAR
jgi:RNA polymerase subunit RPABC4/transcription elongation factor Spt4